MLSKQQIETSTLEALWPHLLAHVRFQQVEAFELMAEPVVYVRSWREALAQFGCK